MPSPLLLVTASQQNAEEIQLQRNSATLSRVCFSTGTVTVERNSKRARDKFRKLLTDLERVEDAFTTQRGVKMCSEFVA